MVVLDVSKYRIHAAEVCPLATLRTTLIESLMRVAPWGMSGNNAWGMVPSSWCVPGDFSNHGRYHFYFPPPIVAGSDEEIANVIPAGAYGSLPESYPGRKSGGLSLLPGGDGDHRLGLPGDKRSRSPSRGWNVEAASDRETMKESNAKARTSASAKHPVARRRNPLSSGSKILAAITEATEILRTEGLHSKRSDSPQIQVARTAANLSGRRRQAST